MRDFNEKFLDKVDSSSEKISRAIIFRLYSILLCSYYSDRGGFLAVSSIERFACTNGFNNFKIKKKAREQGWLCKKDIPSYSMWVYCRKVLHNAQLFRTFKIIIEALWDAKRQFENFYA